MVQALHILALLVVESFANNITEHETPKVLSEEYFRGVKRYCLLLFPWARSSHYYETGLIGSIINSLTYK